MVARCGQPLLVGKGNTKTQTGRQPCLREHLYSQRTRYTIVMSGTVAALVEQGSHRTPCGSGLRGMPWGPGHEVIQENVPLSRHDLSKYYRAGLDIDSHDYLRGIASQIRTYHNNIEHTWYPLRVFIYGGTQQSGPNVIIENSVIYRFLCISCVLITMAPRKIAGRTSISIVS